MAEDEPGEGYEWEWILVDDKVPLPEFIEARARGTMKMESGKVYRKVPIDPGPYQDDYWDYNDIPDDEPPLKYEVKHGK
jgi:hypothetical protein